MKTTKFTLSIIVALLFSIIPTLAWSQASCNAAQTLTVSTTCNAIPGDLQGATNSAPQGACGGATATTTNGVWYKFTATSSKATITIPTASLGSNLTSTSTFIEVLSGSCSTTLISLACQDLSTPLSLSTLTVGSIYYARVYVTGSTTSGGNPNRRGFTICLVSSPNDEPNSAASLTSNISCSNTAGSLLLSTMSTGLPAGCETVGNHWDVWYKFTAANTSSTITISSPGANFTNPEIQLYSGTPGSLISLQCGTTTLTSSSLTIGTTYYIGVSNVGASAPSGAVNFDICVTHPLPPPVNDDCSGATNLNSNTSCSNTSGTLASATTSTGISAGCASPGNLYDVWYKFVATSTAQRATLSSVVSMSNPEIQIFSGTCGTLTSLACGSSSATVAGLTVGNTYYVRVSNVSSPANSGTFNICVTSITPATYEISRTYINVTKGNTGGTVNPGDTLEMRAILAISSKTLDSLSFIDTLYNTKGLRLVPGSLSWRTNEGKIYGNGASPFTDANDADPGGYYTNGLDTIIRINIGSGSSGTARGVLSSSSNPRAGGGCLIMATYRVVVYAPYNTKINFKSGALTYRDQATGILTNANFTPNNLIVYESPGLCPNAVSATNALGAESNGTFGTPGGSAPLNRNRGTTPYIGTGYTYKLFSSTGGPNDNFYGITNNTSQNFTTTNTYSKPDVAPTHRVFNLWDITGDHTGATDPLKGNPACDTTLPISATNPCGYMLVINSAYRADTAFTYTINNLCPNTYYELSAWFKNICSKCGADSLGRQATTTGPYVPTDIGDSSGVRPNIAFDVNGTDYFTTGDIKYAGVAQAGPDSLNRWVKRGFVYLTGPAESSFQLTLRNNAPGGGGNDWALDDISVATCLPNMQYSPSLNPNVCESNPITINDTVRSYFNNHTYYKWQNSTDGGSSWNDIPGTEGNGTPVYKGSAWEYVTSYVVPPTETTMANNNDKYRVIVATASSALSNTNCQFTDGVSIIDVNVIVCGPILNTDLLTFNGKMVNDFAQLSWTTSKEEVAIEFDIERSNDGINFIKVGSVNGHNNNNEINYYTFNDPTPLTKETIYRIMMKNNQYRKISRQIRLYKGAADFKLANVVNPFNNELLFDIVINENTKVDISLTDMYGKQVTHKSYPVYEGVNSLRLDNTDALPAGIYILQVKNKDKKLNKRIFKK